MPYYGKSKYLRLWYFETPIKNLVPIPQIITELNILLSNDN